MHSYSIKLLSIVFDIGADVDVVSDLFFIICDWVIDDGVVTMTTGEMGGVEIGIIVVDALGITSGCSVTLAFVLTASVEAVDQLIFVPGVDKGSIFTVGLEVLE